MTDLDAKLDVEELIQPLYVQVFPFSNQNVCPFVEMGRYFCLKLAMTETSMILRDATRRVRGHYVGGTVLLDQIQTQVFVIQFAEMDSF